MNSIAMPAVEFSAEEASTFVPEAPLAATPAAVGVTVAAFAAGVQLTDAVD